jgi:hypothetical protein
MAPKQQDPILEPLSQSDFHTDNVIVLPSQLSPPLADQRFALHGAVCAGLGCPPDEIVDRLPPVHS